MGWPVIFTPQSQDDLRNARLPVLAFFPALRLPKVGLLRIL
jgi:hypothetical protein